MAEESDIRVVSRSVGNDMRATMERPSVTVEEEAHGHLRTPMPRSTHDAISTLLAMPHHTSPTPAESLPEDIFMDSMAVRSKPSISRRVQDNTQESEHKSPASPEPLSDCQTSCRPLAEFAHHSAANQPSSAAVEPAGHISNKTLPWTIDTTNVTSGTKPSQPHGRPSTSRTVSSPVHTKNVDPRAGLTARKEIPGFPRTTPKSEQSRTRVSQSAPLLSPPLSLATYLQFELSPYRHRQQYAQRTTSEAEVYESSRVKIERLLNFIFLPYQLESVLCFGTLACLDAWLYTFTILPLRLVRSMLILGQSWTTNLVSELHFIVTFVLRGVQRVWNRRADRADRPGLTPPHIIKRRASNAKDLFERPLKTRSRSFVRHHRTRSTASTLSPDDKADMLKGLLIVCTSMILLRLDASRMYHWVRGQAAIKLYVIYNVLEVMDRLLSAIGQDVLECLFSRETLERKPNGRSKILRPMWLFMLALFYTVIHSTALFYQVVTLNVAVNSYSNALMTLLLSNQFVEVKSTVFKKFEKDNLFQLTCADVVERFQIWHMLLIIAARNIVETGGLNYGTSVLAAMSPSVSAVTASNASTLTVPISPPQSTSITMPDSFTFLPSVASTLSSYIPTISQLLGPFIIVLGSEMLIDWLKHAYINKFNNIRPVIYARFLDVLAKDYYANAFGDQNLNKRLGLPVLPLACLLIRASVQTYHMFVAAWIPATTSSTPSLASIHEHYTTSQNATPTSAVGAVVRQIDDLLYRIPSRTLEAPATAYFTTFLVVLLLFLILLACKLILGMVLLAFARSRCLSMGQREGTVGHSVEGARRFGGWGAVEVDDDKRHLIYEDDATGLQNLKDREARETVRRDQEKRKDANMDGLDKVMRYDMVAKRIW